MPRAEEHVETSHRLLAHLSRALADAERLMNDSALAAEDSVRLLKRPLDRGRSSD